MKRYVLTMLIAVFALALNAQTITVKGNVTEKSTNEALIGATVKVKGSGHGTVTDISGNFTISVDKHATLVISSIGYKTVEKAVNGQTVINVSLAEDANDTTKKYAERLT